jgi:hypothetical protein
MNLSFLGIMPSKRVRIECFTLIQTSRKNLKIKELVIFIRKELSNVWIKEMFGLKKYVLKLVENAVEDAILDIKSDLYAQVYSRLKLGVDGFHDSADRRLDIIEKQIKAKVLYEVNKKLPGKNKLGRPKKK